MVGGSMLKCGICLQNPKRTKKSCLFLVVWGVKQSNFSLILEGTLARLWNLKTLTKWHGSAFRIFVRPSLIFIKSVMVFATSPSHSDMVDQRHVLFINIPAFYYVSSSLVCTLKIHSYKYSPIFFWYKLTKQLELFWFICSLLPG